MYFSNITVVSDIVYISLIHDIDGPMTLVMRTHYCTGGQYRLYVDDITTVYRRRSSAHESYSHTTLLYMRLRHDNNTFAQIS